MNWEQKAEMLETIEAWLRGSSGEVQGSRVLYQSIPKRIKNPIIGAWLAAYDKSNPKPHIKRYFASGGVLKPAVPLGEPRSRAEEDFSRAMSEFILELSNEKKIASHAVPQNYQSIAKLFELPETK